MGDFRGTKRAGCGNLLRLMLNPHNFFSVLVVSGALLAGCQKGGRSVESTGADHPLLGSPAPAFELKRIDSDEALGPASSRGKVTIVDFWATWCEPCRQSFPVYEAIARAHPNDVVVLAVSEDEKAAPIPAFVEETGVSFPVVWDADQSVANQYDPATMPTSYFLDRQGIVRFVHVGFTDGDEEILKRQVESLLE